MFYRICCWPVLIDGTPVFMRFIEMIDYSCFGHTGYYVGLLHYAWNDHSLIR